MHYANSLSTAQHLLEREEYHAAIREISGIFEDGLRGFIRRLEKSITALSEKEYFQKLERKIGADRTYQTFHLTQLTRFLDNDKIWHIAKREVTSNLRMSKDIKWKLVAQWRNDATHNTVRLDWDEIQAVQMMIWVKVFLHEFELLENTLRPSQTQTNKVRLKDCPHCNQRMQAKWKFCPDCGTARTIQCRNCGHSLEADFKICPYCEMRTPAAGNGPCNDMEIQYSLLCRGAWMDGVLNVREKEILENCRVKNGIDQGTADRIQRECAPPANLSYHNYVESAHIDHIITLGERHFLDKKAIELGLDDWVKKEIEATFQDQLSKPIETDNE